jgi:hypothetical protein
VEALNVDRFTNLMKMTTSTHDGEALNALRMANAMLKKHDLTWEDVTKTMTLPRAALWAGINASKAAKADGDFRTAAQRTADLKQAMQEAAARTDAFIKASRIRRWFSYLHKHLEAGETREFVNSIQADWSKNRKLTADQASNLERIFRNCVKQNGHDEAVSV